LRAGGSRDLAKEGLKVKEDVSIGFDHSKSMGDSAERACDDEIIKIVATTRGRGKQGLNIPPFSFISAVDSGQAATECAQ